VSSLDLPPQSPRAGNAPSPLVAGVFIVGVIAACIAIWMFVRGPQYEVLYSDLPLEASAAVVKELEANGTDFRLSNGGTRVEVPASELDRLRVTFASAEGVLNGTDGFELFNQSEMGLTEFTQRIKFQRALQGELARTVMAMDDVREARVHLTMPERNLFRSDRTSGKAAVTIRTESGARPSETMVSGIQQLISASVPDLSAENVVVLNARGEAVSVIAAAPAVVDGAIGVGQVSNDLALAMREEIGRIAPGLNHELRAETPQSASTATTPKAEIQVTVRLRSSDDLNPEQRNQAGNAMTQLAQAAGFKGAELLFVTTPLSSTSVMVPEDFAPRAPAAIIPTEQKSLAPTRPETLLDWFMSPVGKIMSISILGALLVGLGALAWWRRTDRAVSSIENQDDVEAARELRQALARQPSVAYGAGQRTRSTGAGNVP